MGAWLDLAVNESIIDEAARTQASVREPFVPMTLILAGHIDRGHVCICPYPYRTRHILTGHVISDAPGNMTEHGEHAGRCTHRKQAATELREMFPS